MRKILIVDDHPLIIIGLEVLVKKGIKDTEVFGVADISSAVKVLKQHKIDLVLLDLGISDGNGPEGLGTLKKHQKDVPVLICSARDEDLNALLYIHNGANGYISKNAPDVEIIFAMQTVIDGKKYLSNKIQQQVLSNMLSNVDAKFNPMKTLSIRETEVLNLLLTGKWTKEIADSLNLKFSTVSTHKMNIFQKLGVDNVLDLFKKVGHYSQ